MEQEKKFRRSIGINLDFQDKGNGIYQGIIEVKTFDLKDFLRDKGFTFDSKATGEVRQDKVVKNFLQRKEIFAASWDKVREQTIAEFSEIVREFQKGLTLPNAPAQNDGATKKTNG